MRIQKTTFQRIIAGALLGVLAACGFDAEIRHLDLSPSQWALAQGNPSLLPIAAFAVDRADAPDPSDLIARTANLRRNALALSGPVISNRDRARLMAAITRREQG